MRIDRRANLVVTWLVRLANPGGARSVAPAMRGRVIAHDCGTCLHRASGPTSVRRNAGDGFGRTCARSDSFRQGGRAADRRRGMSLMIVMVAISMSLVLTFSFLRTQATQLQIRRNSLRRDLALQAAQTGAAVALAQMQSPDWKGVSAGLHRVLQSDADGQTAFDVEFLPLIPREGEPLPKVAALFVTIRSTGSWQPPPSGELGDPHLSSGGLRVERIVEVVAKLHPRLPGRTVSAGDSPAVSDAAPNPGDYDTIQQYALYAEGDDPSLVLEPRGRIDGLIWLEDDLRLYEEPNWPPHVRWQYLDDLGAQFVTSGESWTVRHPHPLGGEITFFTTPRTSRQSDLRRIGLEGRWSKADRRLNRPEASFSPWRRYRLYEGGFEYSARVVDSTLQNVTLRPTADNPLGIFYCDGSVRIQDDVTVQGTLISRGRVEFDGRDIVLASFNWRGDGGAPLVPDVALWPRLPAVVAVDVEFDRDAAALIDGAVVAADEVSGAGGLFEPIWVNAVSIDGTATGTPLEQPWSLVQLETSVDLAPLDGNGNYAVWLTDGASGAWYPIVGVDRSARTLRVIGEVRHETPTPFRIRRARRCFVDIRGPVSAEQCEFRLPDDWEMSELLWSTLHELWMWRNRDRERVDLSPISFLDWLSDSETFQGWPFPLSAVGLSPEPTFHLRYHGTAHYRWETPLFRPFDGGGGNEVFSGYRWDLVSWQEVP